MRTAGRFSAPPPAPTVVEQHSSVADFAFNNDSYQEHPGGGEYITTPTTPPGSTFAFPPQYGVGAQMSHMRVPAGAAPAYTPANMSEEYVAQDERMLESCHHVNLKNLPAGFWVFESVHLAVSVACLVMLIILITR
jgi:hypothetical protein